MGCNGRLGVVEVDVIDCWDALLERRACMGEVAGGGSGPDALKDPGIAGVSEVVCGKVLVSFCSGGGKSGVTGRTNGGDGDAN